MVAGADRQFTCDVPGIKPAANFTWTVGATTTQPGSQQDSPNTGDARLVDSSNTLALDVAGSPGAIQLTCGATNRQDGLTDTEVEVAVTLQVKGIRWACYAKKKLFLTKWK